ncbi:hypothetical protein VSS74_16345 [Conexibacter stalactiti]|uniref:PrgI family protein n=1 Tax=Conexibacter stalactiti TaxID=1940611 RepID=A0ABU4HRQ4_9ACTN|nr:hypothetical protein [Conexibacter stalactiti]MDW5595920.1 hypothetical protein [Conexibacter stalactiti]MEC5036562.1 hypothetical protein [Conexibacter stalactiti]
MFHPAPRRLDEPYKFYGFTIWQWLVLLLGGGGAVAALRALEVGIQVGGFLGTLLVGVPAIYWLLGESGRVEPAELLRDAARHLVARKTFDAGPGEPVALVVASAERRGEAVTEPTGREVPW